MWNHNQSVVVSPLPNCGIFVSGFLVVWWVVNHMKPVEEDLIVSWGVGNGNLLTGPKCRFGETVSQECAQKTNSRFKALCPTVSKVCFRARFKGGTGWRRVVYMYMGLCPA